MFILLYSMFVSVVLDPGGIESARALASILLQYGFSKVQRSCFECATFTEKNLNTLKKDIDRVTDYYDVVRMYQYPIDGMMAITTLNQKKWQRIMLRPPKEKK
jgi:CRISPR-associated protein Cas2